MNNLIVAVKSHFGAMEKGGHDSIRNTWAGALRNQADTRFFLGRPTSEIAGASKSVPSTPHNSYSPKRDEVILDCDDDYESMVWKTRAICKWFVDKKATHLLMVDSDCLVYPQGLFTFPWAQADYAGRFNGGWGNIAPRELPGPGGLKVLIHDCHSWASGGGYLLSKKAATIISETVPVQARYILGSYEDFWVGQILGPLVQNGELLSMPFDRKIVEYYLKDGHSKGYDPESKWMEWKWSQYLKGDV